MRRLDGDELAETVRDRVFQPLADGLARAGWNCIGAARWCVYVGVPLAFVPVVAGLMMAGGGGLVTLAVVGAFLALPLRGLAGLCAEAAELERAVPPGAGDAWWAKARGNMTVPFLAMTLSWLAAALVLVEGPGTGLTLAEHLVVWAVSAGFTLFGAGAMLATCVWRHPPARREPGHARGAGEAWGNAGPPGSKRAPRAL